MSSTLFRLLSSTRIAVSSITRQFPSIARLSTGGIYTPENTEPPIPEYIERSGETLELKRARLLYQSRKRGMTENGLLLSSFAAKYLNNLNDNQLALYDRLINKPTNDWEIYYWITGNKPTPEEYNHQIMDMLKDHAKNKDKDLRLTQPDLYT